MAEVYKCYMEQKRWFNVIADDSDQVVEWIQTHSFQDVDNLTKNYTDEYDEGVTTVFDVMDSDAVEGAHLEKKPGDVCWDQVVKQELEKENETMNDKMARLKALIDESTKIMNDVKAETKRMEEEHILNREAQFDEFKSKIREYMDILGKMENVQIDTGIKSLYGVTDNYYFTLRKGLDDICVHSGEGHGFCLGSISFARTYCGNKAQHRNDIDMDKILDEFDYDKFEDNMAAAISDILAKDAKKVDENYQNAKAILEADS